MIQNSVNILLVEDDQVDQLNVKRAFKKNNITNPLFIAENGIEALELLRGEGAGEKIVPVPQIILLDINMPKMDGLEFLKELRKDENLKSISVFILTTSDEDSDKFKAYDLNVAGYIVKPVGFEKFVEAVSKLNTFWQLCERPSA